MAKFNRRDFLPGMQGYSTRRQVEFIVVSHPDNPNTKSGLYDKNGKYYVKVKVFSNFDNRERPIYSLFAEDVSENKYP